MAFLKVLSAALLLGFATLQPCQGQSRIIGGTPVVTNRFPYFAKLRIVFTENGQQFVTYCGGALITSEVVLVGSIGSGDALSYSPPNMLMICFSLVVTDGGPLSHQS